MGKRALDIKSILEGWKNYIFPNEEVEEIAKHRLLVCSKCPHRINSKCGECGCPLETKARAVNQRNKCPKDKWLR